MIKYNKATNFIVIVAMSTVIAPFIFLGDNYAFTVHDYLDSYPGWMHIVQKIPAIPSYYETSGIMGGMPAFYFYREITVYMILNHYFGFVQAELVNRFITIVIGYFSMKYLLQLLFNNNLSINMMKLIAVSYAITPTYIFSRYKIINADELGINMIYEHNSEDSIYHILVYELT